MKLIIRILCTAILFFGFNLQAQEETMDSLIAALKNAKHDTIRCHILEAMIEAENDDNIWPSYNDQLKKLCEENLAKFKNDKTLQRFYLKYFGSALNNLGYLAQQNGDLPKALEYLNESMRIQEKIGDKKGVATTLNNIGLVFHVQGNVAKELEYFLSSCKISNEIGDKVSEAKGMNNIGALYQVLGDIPNALEHHLKSLKLLEELGDKKGASQAINDIALIYDNLGDLEKAMEYYSKSLRLRKEIPYKNGIAESLNNIGLIYFQKKDYTTALNYYMECLKIYEDLKNKPGICMIYGNIGSLYEIRKDFVTALDYCSKSLKISEEIEDKYGVAVMNKRMASVYYNLKEYDKALKFALQSMKIAKELGYPESIKTSANLLYRIYKGKGDSKNALSNYRLYYIMKDSLNNKEIQKASIRSQFKIEYDRKEKQAKLEQEKKDLKNAEEKQKQIMIRNSFIGGFAMVLILVMVIMRSFIQNKKKNKLIEAQKQLVEEKQKEIVDSIYYAQRIQKALMPSEKYLEKSLNKLQTKN